MSDSLSLKPQLLSKTLTRVIITGIFLLLPLSIISLSIILTTNKEPTDIIRLGLLNLTSKPLVISFLASSFYFLLIIYDYKPKIPYTFTKDHKIDENILLSLFIILTLPIFTLFTYKYFGLETQFRFIDNIYQLSIISHILSLILFLMFINTIIISKYNDKYEFNVNNIISLTLVSLIVSIIYISITNYNLYYLVLGTLFANSILLRRIRYTLLDDDPIEEVQRLWNAISRVPIVILIIYVLVFDIINNIVILTYIPIIVSIIYLIQR